MRNLLARVPTATLLVDTSSTNISHTGWTEIKASLDKGCDAFEVVNPGGAPLLLAIGASSSEVQIPYTVPPGGTSVLVPVNLAKGARLTAKVSDTADMTSGKLILNFFG